MGARVKIRGVDKGSRKGMTQLGTEGGGVHILLFKGCTRRGQVKLEPHPDCFPLRV